MRPVYEKYIHLMREEEALAKAGPDSEVADEPQNGKLKMEGGPFSAGYFRALKFYTLLTEEEWLANRERMRVEEKSRRIGGGEVERE